MKRAFLLSFFALVGAYPAITEAQAAADCAGRYSGTYTGDLSGNLTGSLSLGECGALPSAIEVLGFILHGSLPQYFFEDLTRIEMNVAPCVVLDENFSGGPGVSITFVDGRVRELFVGGTMDLNTCTLSGSWLVELTPPGGSPATEKTGSFTMSLAPIAREPVRWTALNGDFNEPSNWTPQEVPGVGQDAVFDQNQTYTVSFGSPASSGGFIVEEGFPTFLTGSYAATGGSGAAPSAIIGNSNLNSAILTLANHHLTTAFSNLGQSPGSNATVFLEEGATWTEQGRMVIGKAGSGDLDLGIIARVTSMETQLGADASGEGTVEIFASGDSEWTTGSIAIGLRGKGEVTQEGGSIQSHTVSLGVEAGSDGTVTVGSAGNTAIWEFDGPLTVGQRGKGYFDIVAGGFVTSTANEVVEVGSFEGAVGTLSIDGAGSELSAPDSNLGLGVFGGTGTMILRNDAKVTCDLALIGNSGPGILLIENSKFTCISILTSGSGTVILNNGTLSVTNVLGILAGTLGGRGLIVAPNANITGTVMPGAVDLPLPPPPKGLPVPGEPIGTLTFGGNVNFGSATLEIEVGGLAEGAFDVIHATGAVDILDSTVLFRFVDGFLPRTGDIVPFLVADGGVTVANLILEFEGVADGFQFEVNEENGMLVFEALNDAQPAPVPSADLDGDREIDFVDLLIFIELMRRETSP